MGTVQLDQVIKTDFGQFDLGWSEASGFDGDFDRFFAETWEDVAEVFVTMPARLACSLVVLGRRGRGPLAMLAGTCRLRVSARDRDAVGNREAPTPVPQQ